MKTLDMTMLAGRDVRLVLIFDRSENVGGLRVTHWTLISWMELPQSTIERMIPDQDVRVKLVSSSGGWFRYSIDSSTDSSG